MKKRMTAIVLALGMLMPLGAAPAVAASVPCSMSQSYWGSYLTCDGKKVKVFTTIWRDRQINWGFTDGSGHWVSVYSASWYTISAKHSGTSFVCSMSWGGLCQ